MKAKARGMLPEQLAEYARPTSSLVKKDEKKRQLYEGHAGSKNPTAPLQKFRGKTRKIFKAQLRGTLLELKGFDAVLARKRSPVRPRGPGTMLFCGDVCQSTFLHGP